MRNKIQVCKSFVPCRKGCDRVEHWEVTAVLRPSLQTLQNPTEIGRTRCYFRVSL